MSCLSAFLLLFLSLFFWFCRFVCRGQSMLFSGFGRFVFGGLFVLTRLPGFFRGPGWVRLRCVRVAAMARQLAGRDVHAA